MLEEAVTWGKNQEAAKQGRKQIKLEDNKMQQQNYSVDFKSYNILDKRQTAMLRMSMLTTRNIYVSGSFNISKWSTKNNRK